MKNLNVNDERGTAMEKYQDILGVNVADIVEKGKKRVKKRKHVAIIILLGLLGVGILYGIKLCHMYTRVYDLEVNQEIREVETAIDNIANDSPKCLEDILFARKAYEQLDDSQKESVMNIQKLEDEEREITESDTYKVFAEIVEALEYPLTKGGKQKVERILESLDDVAKNDVKEMLRAAMSTDKELLHSFWRAFGKQDLDELIP